MSGHECGVQEAMEKIIMKVIFLLLYADSFLNLANISNTSPLPLISLHFLKLLAFSCSYERLFKKIVYIEYLYNCKAITEAC